MTKDVTPMDDLAIEGCRLRVRVEGPDTGPPLVLAHMLGTDLTLWDGLLPALERFRVIRFDARGHGGSELGEAGFGIDRLGRDVLDILDALEIERAHFCGLSMGGAVGLWLLAHAPERIDRAVIAGAAAKLGTPEGWNARIAAARAGGMEQAVAPTIERWFSPEFAAQDAPAVESVGAMIRATSVEGYAACCAALRDMDLREAVRSVAAPVLVARGSRDPSVSAGDLEALVAAIEGATSLELAAHHCASIEDRDGFASAIVKFLTAKTAPRTAKTAPRRVAQSPRAKAGIARAAQGVRAETGSARAETPARRLGGRGLSARRPGGVPATSKSSASRPSAAAPPPKAKGTKTSTKPPGRAVATRPVTSKSVAAKPAKAATRPSRAAPPKTAKAPSRPAAKPASAKTAAAAATRARGTAVPASKSARATAASRETGASSKAAVRKGATPKAPKRGTKASTARASIVKASNARLSRAKISKAETSKAPKSSGAKTAQSAGNRSTATSVASRAATRRPAAAKAAKRKQATTRPQTLIKSRAPAKARALSKVKAKPRAAPSKPRAAPSKARAAPAKARATPAKPGRRKP